MPVTDASAEPALDRYARLAGFLYLTIIVTSILAGLGSRPQYTIVPRLNRALLALLWRMAEAVVGAVTVLLGVLVVLLVDSAQARATTLANIAMS